MKPDRLDSPKHIARVCWKNLVKPSVSGVFNSHLQKTFNHTSLVVMSFASFLPGIYSSLLKVNYHISKCGITRAGSYKGGWFYCEWCLRTDGVVQQRE